MRTRVDILTELAVIRAQRGEAKAFEIPVKLWQTRLRVHAVRLVGETEAANDAMLKVWMAVSRGIRRVDDPVRFRSWVYRIVRNKRADLIRSEQARRRLTQKLIDVEAESSSDERGDDSRVDKLRTVIRTLPEEQRMVLTMFYLEEIPFRDIRFVLRIPDGTVKSRLCHAQLMLKEALEV